MIRKLKGLFDINFLFKLYLTLLSKVFSLLVSILFICIIFDFFFFLRIGIMNLIRCQIEGQS